MQVFHTFGEPPRCGNIILLTIGCTRNNRQAPTNSVTANPGSSSDRGKATGRMLGAVLTSRLMGSRAFSRDPNSPVLVKKAQTRRFWLRRIERRRRPGDALNLGAKMTQPGQLIAAPH